MNYYIEYRTVGGSWDDFYNSLIYVAVEGPVFFE